MAKVALTQALRAEYETLFNSCMIRQDRRQAVEDVISQLNTNRARYENVTEHTGVPWAVVGVIHNMEGSLDFRSHLHNGDPLTDRTVHVPSGRPRTGTPPFAWEESAIDALAMRRLDGTVDWSLAGTLYQLEGFNGWGYRLFHPHVLTPYLWSSSNHYRSGKYVADGTWSDTAVSKQCGAAVILRRMAEYGNIEFPDQPAPGSNAMPLIVNYATERPADPAEVLRAEQLQQWLNTFPGIFVNIDGIAGPKTSEAYKKVTGAFLPGDPRA